MKRLWHWPIDPLARTVRLALGEKRCAVDLVIALPWAQPGELAAMAPGARAPVMVDTGAEEKVSAAGAHAICEYLEEAIPSPRLLPFVAQERAEARQQCHPTLCGQRACGCVAAPTTGGPAGSGSAEQLQEEAPRTYGEVRARALLCDPA